MVSSLRSVSSIRSVLSLIDPTLRRRWVVVAILGVAVSALEAVGARTVVLFASLQDAKTQVSIPLIGDITSRLPFDSANARTLAPCAIVAGFFIVLDTSSLASRRGWRPRPASAAPGSRAASASVS